MSTYTLKNNTRLGSLSLIIATVAMIVAPLLGVFTKYAEAAGISSISDTMSSQVPAATSNHIFVWTSTGTNAATGTVAVDLASADFSFNAPGSWQATDFTLSDSVGSRGNPVAVGAAPACSAGANNYTVTIDDTNETFTITFCSGWTENTASTATTFTVLGTTAVGTGTVTNGSDVDSSLYTITYAVTQTTSGQGAVVIETNSLITVTATVNSTLTLSISSSTCSLGTLSTGSVSTCNYTITSGTNATGGEVITIQALSDGTNAFLNNDSTPAQYIDDIAEDGTVSAGTEGYGIAVTAGAGFTEAGDFADDDTPIPSALTTILNSGGAPVASAASTITHRAAISSVTPAGTYSQQVQYIATGTF